MNELVDRIDDNEDHEDAAVDREQANFVHNFQLKEAHQLAWHVAYLG